MRRSRDWLRLAFLLASLAPFAAAAQETQPAPAAATQPAAGAPPVGVEEILVTTQKRAQNLQDVPISVTAITGNEISELGIAESVDIAAQTPGLKIGFPAGETNNPAIFLRGVGLNDYNANSNGSVGWYMDDVYISQVTAQTFQLFDLERVEVARGPQGTLYGRNTTGGLVNFISKKPSHEESDGYFTASYGEWDAIKLEGAYGGPLTDTLAGRLALTYNRDHGYIDNELTGHENNNTKNWAGRVALDWQASENASFLFGLSGAKNDSLAAQYEHQGTNDPLTGAPCGHAQIRTDQCVDAFGFRDDKNNERGQYNKEGDLDVDAWGSFLRAEIDLGELTLTSITAYEWIDKLFEEDTDASPNNLIEIDYLNDGWELTQELRLAGESERIHWQTGLYYIKERIHAQNFLDLFHDLRPLAESVDPDLYPGGFAPAGCPPDPDDPSVDPCGGAPIFFSLTEYRQTDESVGVFAQGDVDLTERLRATVGFRYTWEWRDFHEEVTFIEPTFEVPVFPTPYDKDANFDEWSGRFALDYRPTEDLLLYASASRGFKSGGFSGAFAFSKAEIPPFDPETIWAYEAGAKWELFDRRVRLNVGGFYYDYKDLQVFTVVAVSPTVTISILDNAGKAKLYGGEIELEAQPLAGLDVSLGLALLHSELTKFETDAVDYSGNRLVFAPEVTWNGRVRYEHPLGPGAVALLTDWNYQGETFFDNANDPTISQDGYWVWNARVSYLFGEGQRYELAAFGRNLLDEDYLTYAFPLGGFGFNEQMWGRPRSWGLEATVRF